MTGTVSVIVPTRDRGALLISAVASAIAANAADEIIVVDGGSSDGSIESVEVLPNVKVSRGDFPNAATTRNAGAAVAGCDYLAFLDSDDEMLAAKVTALRDVLDRNPHVGLVHGRTTVIDEHGVPDECATLQQELAFGRAERLGTTYPRLAAHCAMFTSATLLRRSAFESIGGYDESLGVYEDWDLYLRLSIAWRLTYSTVVTARYRIWEGNVEWDRTAAGTIEVAKKHLRALPPLNEVDQKAARYAFLRRIAEASHVLVDGTATRRAALSAGRVAPAVFLRDTQLLGMVGRSMIPRPVLRRRRPAVRPG